MGANDDILADDKVEGEKPAAGTAASLDATAVSKMVSQAMDTKLAEHGQRLDKFGADIAKYVQDVVGGAQRAKDAGTATNVQTDLVQQFYTDPATATEKLM